MSNPPPSLPRSPLPLSRRGLRIFYFLFISGQKSHLSGMSEKHFVAALDAETNSVIVAKGRSHPSLFSRGLSSRASEFHWVAGVPPRELLLPLSSPLSDGNDGGGGGGRGSLTPIVVDTRRDDATTTTAAAGGGSTAAGRRFLRCTYRCRHRQELLPCTVELLSEGHATRRFDDGTVNPEEEVEEEEEEERRTLAALVTLRFDEPAKAIAPGQVVALYRDGVCLGGGPILRAEGALPSGGAFGLPPSPLPQPRPSEGEVETWCTLKG